MKNRAAFFIVLIYLVSVFTGCSSRPDNILSKKVFVKILAEFLIIEKLSVSDTEKQKLIKKTLNDFETTADQFKATKEYYKTDDKFWLSVYKKAQERIDNKKTTIQKEVLQRLPQEQKPSVKDQ